MSSSWPPWTGRSRSAGGGPPTSGRSWPPALAPPIPGRPGTPWSWTCPRCRSARWPTTRSAGCHDRRCHAAAGRPGRQGSLDVRAGPVLPVRRRPAGLPGPGRRPLRPGRLVRGLRPAALHPRQGHPGHGTARPARPAADRRRKRRLPAGRGRAARRRRRGPAGRPSLEFDRGPRRHPPGRPAALRRRTPVTAQAPPLAADIAAGLRRLKLATMRQLAPELLITARTQRRAPEELLRTLIDAEIAARDASNAATRMKAAAFPVAKTLDELDRAACSIPGPTLDYLASLEWITARENLCLVGPAGTGKSHVLVALGINAVHAGHKVRYFTAAELTETLYRGLADNSVGKVIENLLRNDLILVDEIGFAPLDDTGAQLLFRLVSAAYERRSLGVASHWPFESWGRFLPEHTTAVSLLDRLLHHANVVITAGDSYRMRQARARGGTTLNKH